MRVPAVLQVRGVVGQLPMGQWQRSTIVRRMASGVDVADHDETAGSRCVSVVYVGKNRLEATDNEPE